MERRPSIIALPLLAVLAALAMAQLNLRSEEPASPQPPVFLWSYGFFEKAEGSEEETLVLSLSYCGENAKDPLLPALNDPSQVKLTLNSQPVRFELKESFTRARIEVSIP